MAEHGRRPLILIPARFSESASALRYQAEVTARNLVAAVFAAGGEPLVVHPHAPEGVVPDDIGERLAIADGVLLPGGGDLAARWSGQESHETEYDVDEEQDAFDIGVARHCLAAGIPLLAICRGLQVVNSVLGGTLVQDMAEVHRHVRHRVPVGSGSTLRGIVGDSVDVSCYHHQCLDRLGEGMVAVALSESGVVEAAELSGAAGWFLGLQWHPEDTWREDPHQAALFAAHVAAANRHREAVSSR